MNIKCLNSNYTNNQLLINRTNSQKMLDIIIAGLTNGFLKFLARFSGKFRPFFFLFILLLLIILQYLLFAVILMFFLEGFFLLNCPMQLES